jgi:hypothetical protein
VCVEGAVSVTGRAADVQRLRLRLALGTAGGLRPCRADRVLAASQAPRCLPVLPVLSLLCGQPVALL